MREYATPLSERQRLAAHYRRKYWSDPDFRLKGINRWRIWKGLEPYASLDEMQRGRAA
jgi:hypothetical protein